MSDTRQLAATIREIADEIATEIEDTDFYYANSLHDNAFELRRLLKNLQNRLNPYLVVD